MKFQLPDLPYAKDALAPFMSKETLEYHYGKHHNAYVTKLNAILESPEGESHRGQSLEKIILSSKGALFNNAAQHWNHSFFWRSLSPTKTQIPSEMESKIKTAFGGLQAFQDEFVAQGLKQFGSGWVWLVADKNGDYKIKTTSNADTPMVTGDRALLTMDVWEHAYYIDYRNDRKKFLDTWWSHVNWDFAKENAQAK